MSSENHFIKALSLISSQIQQLTNIYVVKYVNTGDRVIDGAVSVMINSMLVLLGSFVYKWLSTLFDPPKHKETDSPTDINHMLFDYSQCKMDEIMKYKHKLRMDFILNTTLKWIKNTYHVIDTNQQINHTITSNNTNTNIGMGISYAEEDKYCMPIWKWKNDKTQKYEYIWLIGKTLYSNNFNELEKIFHKIKELYEKSFTKVSDNKKELVILNYPSRNVLGNVQINCTFDRMWFDTKNHLMDMLDKCKTNQLYPPSLGMTNKLGILLYGPPGTGKTACISAIANHLNRHILRINSMSEYQLEKILLGDLFTFNKTHVIVIDEIDYLLCKQQTDNTSIYKYKEELMMCTDKEERKQLLKDISEMSSEDTTRILLEYLDGMIDNTDRVIVATTNHPEKINPLFLRPGRFDLKLKLGYCSAPMFQDIVRTMYPDYSLDNDEITINSVSSLTTEEIMGTDQPKPMDMDKLLAKNITPVVLINTMIQTNSLNELMYELEKLPFTEDIYTHTF